jgi:hypothetical protein
VSVFYLLDVLTLSEVVVWLNQCISPLLSPLKYLG